MATKIEPKALLTAPITVEQWSEDEGVPRYDLVEGRLREIPDVAFWHDILLAKFLRFLLNYVEERGLGLLVSSTANLKISGQGGHKPDIFFIPTALFHLARKNFFNGIPPLVVEILSPTNEQTDRVEKFREYAQLGIGEYWIIDFAHRRIEIYRLEPQLEGSSVYDRAATVEGADAVFQPDFFPGLIIPMGQVWPTEFEHLADDE